MDHSPVLSLDPLDSPNCTSKNRSVTESCLSRDSDTTGPESVIPRGVRLSFRSLWRRRSRKEETHTRLLVVVTDTLWVLRQLYVLESEIGSGGFNLRHKIVLGDH